MKVHTVIVTAMLVHSIAAFAQGLAPASTEPDLGSIAKSLVDRHALLDIPRKGKVKRGVKMSDAMYPLPGGSSRAVLLKLPEYQSPYELTLSSFIVKRWGLKEGVFVPTTVVLDEDFVVTRTVPDTELQLMPQSWSKTLRLEVTLSFTETERRDRFLLIYTQASAVGEHLSRAGGGTAVPSGGAAGAAIGSMLTHRERSADGTIEVETKPATWPDPRVLHR